MGVQVTYVCIFEHNVTDIFSLLSGIITGENQFWLLSSGHIGHNMAAMIENTKRTVYYKGMIYLVPMVRVENASGDRSGGSAIFALHGGRYE